MYNRRRENVQQIVNQQKYQSMESQTMFTPIADDDPSKMSHRKSESHYGDGSKKAVMKRKSVNRLQSYRQHDLYSQEYSASQEASVRPGDQAFTGLENQFEQEQEASLYLLTGQGQGGQGAQFPDNLQIAQQLRRNGRAAGTPEQHPPQKAVYQFPPTDLQQLHPISLQDHAEHEYGGHFQSYSTLLPSLVPNQALKVPNSYRMVGGHYMNNDLSTVEGHTTQDETFEHQEQHSTSNSCYSKKPNKIDKVVVNVLNLDQTPDQHSRKLKVSVQVSIERQNDRSARTQKKGAKPKVRYNSNPAKREREKGQETKEHRMQNIQEILNSGNKDISENMKMVARAVLQPEHREDLQNPESKRSPNNQEAQVRNYHGYSKLKRKFKHKENDYTALNLAEIQENSTRSPSSNFGNLDILNAGSVQLQHNANVSPRANDGRDGKKSVSVTIAGHLQRKRNANGIEEGQLPLIVPYEASSAPQSLSPIGNASAKGRQRNAAKSTLITSNKIYSSNIDYDPNSRNTPIEAVVSTKRFEYKLDAIKETSALTRKDTQRTHSTIDIDTGLSEHQKVEDDEDPPPQGNSGMGKKLSPRIHQAHIEIKKKSSRLQVARTPINLNDELRNLGEKKNTVPADCPPTPYLSQLQYLKVKTDKRSVAQQPATKSPSSPRSPHSPTSALLKSPASKNSKYMSPGKKNRIDQIVSIYGKQVNLKPQTQFELLNLAGNNAQTLLTPKKKSVSIKQGPLIKRDQDKIMPRHHIKKQKEILQGQNLRVDNITMALLQETLPAQLGKNEFGEQGKQTEEPVEDEYMQNANTLTREQFQERIKKKYPRRFIDKKRPDDKDELVQLLKMPKKSQASKPGSPVDDEPMIYITSSHPPEAENPKSSEQQVLIYVDMDGQQTSKAQLDKSPTDMLAQQIHQEIAAMRALQPDAYQKYVQLRQKELNLDLEHLPMNDQKFGIAENEAVQGSKKQMNQLMVRNRRNQSTARAKTIAKNRKQGNDSHLEMQKKYKNFSEYAEKVCPDIYDKINQGQYDQATEIQQENPPTRQNPPKQERPFGHVEKLDSNPKGVSNLSQNRSDSNLTSNNHAGPDQFAFQTLNRVSILQNSGIISTIQDDIREGVITSKDLKQNEDLMAVHVKVIKPQTKEKEGNDKHPCGVDMTLNRHSLINKKNAGSGLSSIHRSSRMETQGKLSIQRQMEALEKAKQELINQQKFQQYIIEQSRAEYLERHRREVVSNQKSAKSGRNSNTGIQQTDMSSVMKQIQMKQQQKGGSTQLTSGKAAQAKIQGPHAQTFDDAHEHNIKKSLHQIGTNNSILAIGQAPKQQRNINEEIEKSLKIMRSLSPSRAINPVGADISKLQFKLQTMQSVNEQMLAQQQINSHVKTPKRTSRIDGIGDESGLTIDQIQQNLQSGRPQGGGRGGLRDVVDPIIENTLENFDAPWLGSAHRLQEWDDTGIDDQIIKRANLQNAKSRKLGKQERAQKGQKTPRVDNVNLNLELESNNTEQRRRGHLQGSKIHQCSDGPRLRGPTESQALLFGQGLAHRNEQNKHAVINPPQDHQHSHHQREREQIRREGREQHNYYSNQNSPKAVQQQPPPASPPPQIRKHLSLAYQKPQFKIGLPQVAKPKAAAKKKEPAYIIIQDSPIEENLPDAPSKPLQPPADEQAYIDKFAGTQGSIQTELDAEYTPFEIEDITSWVDRRKAEVEKYKQERAARAARMGVALSPGK